MPSYARLRDSSERTVVGTPVSRSVLERIVAFARQNVIALVLGVLLIWLVAGPIGLLINLSLRGGSPAAPGTDLTLSNYGAVYGSVYTWPAALNTLVYAVLVTIVSITLATLFAWLVERTDMPFRSFAWIAMLIPIAVPGMLASMAWILMLSPRTGVLNVAIRSFMALFGVDLGGEGPINIYSMGGMVFIEGVRGANTLFLMLVGAFRLMDPSLEDASIMSGASKFQTVRHVTLPLMFPALLAATIYAFLGNLDDFDTPLLIGLPAGIFVLPTLIYFTAYVSPTPNWGLASAYTSLFVVVMVFLVAYYYRVVIKRSKRFATVTGKGFRPARLKLGRWRYVAIGSFGLYFGLTILMPVGILLYASLLPVYRVPSMEVLDLFTLSNYARVLDDGRLIRAVTNTFVIAGSTATITMVFAFIVSWAVVRVKVRGGVLMDALAFAPNAIPTVAIGLGLAVFYLSPTARWTGIYGSVFILIIALSTKYLAFATRIGNSSMTQIAGELEEASWVSGVGKLMTLARITTPLLLPTFLAGWIWVVAHAFRNLTLPLLLATPRTEVLSMRLYYYWVRDSDFSLTAALGVMLILSLSIFAFASRRIITKGFSGD